MKNFLIVLLIVLVAGCKTTGEGSTPSGFEQATPERVELVTDLIGGRLQNMTPEDVDREFLAVLACTAVGATAYFIENLGDASKEERVLAAINAANRHGRLFYQDVLGERTYLEVATEEFGLDAGSSNAEKMIGILRYGIQHRMELLELIRQVSPSASSSIEGSASSP